MTQQYNLSNIRALLTEGFDDQELRRFIFDTQDFKPVYNLLGAHSGKAEIAHLLIEYAKNTMALPKLLELLNHLNPTRFKNHEPYYVLPDPGTQVVPIVLVVMTPDEAQYLEDGRALSKFPTLRRDFKQLQAWLKQHGMNKWVDCYRAEAREWQPLLCDEYPGAKSIEQLVLDAFKEINESVQQFEPLFIDIHSLKDNRKHLKDLRREGCVVIVDSISMRHPEIQRLFNLSALDVHPKTYVVTVTPAVTPGVFAVTREMTIVIELRIKDMEFVKRRDEYEDYGECEETHETQRFKVWLQNRVKKTYPSKTALQNRIFEGKGLKAEGS